MRMKRMMTIQIVLGLTGVVFCVVGAVILAGAARTNVGFARTSAVVREIGQGGAPNSLRAVVEFTADGETVRQSAAEVTAGTLSAQIGDTVEILYRRTGMLGADAWEILLCRENTGEVLRARIRLKTMAGCLFLGLGIVIIVVLAILLIKKH